MGMLSVDIICSYYATVDTFISIETLEIDSLVDDNKIDNPSAPAELNVDVVQYVLKVDESLYDENTEVALGSDMKLEFTSVAGLTQFYVHQCFAYNELPVDNDNYASVVIIENGCAVNADADPEKSIKPQLIDNGQTLAFSQFAFIGQKDDADSNDIELKFRLSCTLKFGSAPNCLTSRRNDETTETTDIMLDYQVEIVPDWRISNSVVFTDDSSSSDSSSIRNVLHLTHFITWLL